MIKAQHTPGPWKELHGIILGYQDDAQVLIATVSTYAGNHGTSKANGFLIAAAPELIFPAQAFLCLANSPRFVDMTVSRAIKEMVDNGLAPVDFGASAITKAVGI